MTIPASSLDYLIHGDMTVKSAPLSHFAENGHKAEESAVDSRNFAISKE